MTATALPTEQVTAPGVYELNALTYHAERDWLSSTGARQLLPPSCPALFRWDQDHPRPTTKALDTGSVAHDELLGGGPEVARIEADNWLTKAAKQQRDEARARGAVPILAHEHDEVRAMVAAVRAHPIAGKLFQPGSGTPEASLFWVDEQTGVQRRARLDWLPHRTGRRTIVADLKTTRSAEKDKFAKSALDYGYHQQAAYYLDAVIALDLADDPVFVFVAIEKTAPYLVNVIQLDVTAMRIGAHLNRRAIATYKQCADTGHWPSYSDDVELASLPHWYEARFDNEDI